MTLRERYRRLTLWNKLGACGALASVVGVVLAVAFWLLPPTAAPAPAPTAPATPPAPSVAVTGSSNTTVIQAGRDVVVNQPVTVRRVDPTVFRDPSPAVQRRLASQLRALLVRYPRLRIQVDVETGSSLRYRVGDTLGKHLEQAGVGAFGRTNTMMGVAPGHAVTAWCAPGNEQVARAALEAVAAYLRSKAAVSVEAREGAPEYWVHVYINGQPQFREDGSVDVE